MLAVNIIVKDVLAVVHEPKKIERCSFESGRAVQVTKRL